MYEDVTCLIIHTKHFQQKADGEADGIRICLLPYSQTNRRHRQDTENDGEKDAGSKVRIVAQHRSLDRASGRNLQTFSRHCVRFNYATSFTLSSLVLRWAYLISNPYIFPLLSFSPYDWNMCRRVSESGSVGPFGGFTLLNRRGSDDVDKKAERLIKQLGDPPTARLKGRKRKKKGKTVAQAGGANIYGLCKLTHSKHGV